jgi:hypothetical protein
MFPIAPTRESVTGPMQPQIAESLEGAGLLMLIPFGLWLELSFTDGGETGDASTVRQKGGG